MHLFLPLPLWGILIWELSVVLSLGIIRSWVIELWECRVVDASLLVLMGRVYLAGVVLLTRTGEEDWNGQS